MRSYRGPYTIVVRTKAVSRPILIPVRAADPGIENIYDLGIPITMRDPYPTSCSLRRPIDSPHLTVTVVDLGVPILTRGSLSYG